jgi:D-serine dehydratase
MSHNDVALQNLRARNAVHVVWITGGSQLPEDQFAALPHPEAL